MKGHGTGSVGVGRSVRVPEAGSTASRGRECSFPLEFAVSRGRRTQRPVLPHRRSESPEVRPVSLPLPHGRPLLVHHNHSGSDHTGDGPNVSLLSEFPQIK